MVYPTFIARKALEDRGYLEINGKFVKMLSDVFYRSGKYHMLKYNFSGCVHAFYQFNSAAELVNYLENFE